MKTQVIEITVSGKPGCGKSSIIASIKNLLEESGLNVAYVQKELRSNPPKDLEACDQCDKPSADKAIVLLFEEWDCVGEV